jgi:hypothetical protein
MLRHRVIPTQECQIATFPRENLRRASSSTTTDWGSVSTIRIAKDDFMKKTLTGNNLSGIPLPIDYLTVHDRTFTDGQTSDMREVSNSTSFLNPHGL